jgi:acetyltransferase-like isoleucine patch superfamily enzyme
MVYIHETAIVEDGAIIKDGTKIWMNAQIRNCTIGFRCNIGKNVYLDKNVIIGNCVKIQNNANIYDGVTIEKKAFIGQNVCFTNDKFPRSFNRDWKLVKTLVKEGASIGANSTIICGVTIGKYAMIGAGSVITKDVPDYGLVVGNPARLIGYVNELGERVSDYGLTTDKGIYCNISED